MKSRTAIRLVREWIDLHVTELREDWELAQAGEELKKIDRHVRQNTINRFGPVRETEKTLVF